MESTTLITYMDGLLEIIRLIINIRLILILNFV